CLLVFGWSEPAGAASGGAQAGADVGGLRGAARRHPSFAGLPTQSGRESGGLGGAAAGSLSARAGRQAPGADRHRRLRGFGGGDSNGVSAGATSALLGAQDAEYSGESAQVRLRRSEGRSAGHVLGGKPGKSRGRVPQLPRPLAAGVRADGAAVGTRLAGVAVV